jgi:hypothetical protein
MIATGRGTIAAMLRVVVGRKYFQLSPDKV